jgi:hypothetical protein
MPPVTSQSLRPTAAQKLTLSHKTLTPKRKHRKMLKDGTSEVWPEAVEALFVEGADPRIFLAAAFRVAD